MTDDDDILAAEAALGLAEDRSAIETRIKSEADFAARVSWWQERFAGLATGLEADPPPNLWPRISARLPQNDNDRAVRRWQWISGALAATAAVALFLVAQQTSVPALPSETAPVIASLGGETGSSIAISYDTFNRALSIAPLKLDPGKGDAELWVIPKGASEAISLGVIDARKPSTRQLAEDQARLVGPGATLAISLEPIGGSPTGKATGPIVASGKLIET